MYRTQLHGKRMNILDFCKKVGVEREATFYTTKLKLNNGYDNVKNENARFDACRLENWDS